METANPGPPGKWSLQLRELKHQTTFVVLYLQLGLIQILSLLVSVTNQLSPAVHSRFYCSWGWWRW